MATVDFVQAYQFLHFMSESHRITPNVLEILDLLARYRYLRTSFIYGLLPHRNERGIRATLTRLRRHGYVALPRSQWRGYNSLYCCNVYEITPKGIDLLKDKRPERATNLIRHRGDAPIKNFAHSMMICDALASIETGAKANACLFIPLDAILERVEGDSLKLPCRIKGQASSLVPDGLFGIRYPDKKVKFFILEAEHYNPINPSDLKRASFKKKAYAYNDIARERPYVKQFGIPNLHYLFVFPTPARVESAWNLIDELFPNTRISQRIYMTDIPVQEELMKAPPPFPDLFKSLVVQ